MTDREKLIELLGGDMCKGCYCEDCEHENNEKSCIEHIKRRMADHLIAHGVTVQECNAGDTIYEVDGEHGVIKHDVYDVCVVFKTTATDDRGNEWDDYWTTDDIGNAYKTRIEAEANLPQPPKGE